MDRIKIADIDNERYYQVPVAFFTNPYYRGSYQVILNLLMQF